MHHCRTLNYLLDMKEILHACTENCKAYKQRRHILYVWSPGIRHFAEYSRNRNLPAELGLFPLSVKPLELVVANTTIVLC